MITIVFALLCVVLAFGVHVKASKPEQDFVSCVTDGLGVFFADIKAVISASKTTEDAPEELAEPEPEQEPEPEEESKEEK